MRMSWKLGRVAGIDVYLHPTFLIVLAYPQVIEGGSLALLLVLAAFGCVLLHEFGHALMARRFGIETEDITLYPIGGVARLRRMPRSPGAELAIALAGPAVNFAIVAGLLVLDLFGLFDGSWGPSPAGYFFGSLMWINLFLGLFNLIPAFPMDGGRVLRALLSGWLGRARATMIAAGIGRGLALAFGFYSLFQGRLMWVALAAFIYVVAGMELKRVLAEERRLQESEGIWVAPPGYRWIQQGDGVWQLAPLTVRVGEQPFTSWR